MSNELLLKLRDHFQAIADAYDQELEQCAPPETARNSLDEITWTKAEGKKGPYERAEEQDSVAFRALINDLDEQQGKLQREGYFIWLFSDGKTIGRKPSKR